jgi:uncharacterized protein with HEPN domain
MSRPVADRLRDIIYSADLAVRHAGDLDAIALSAENDRGDATLFRLAVIGEAVSHLPAELQALAPEISWSDVKSMRNHIIHGYWQIDFSIIVETISLDVEPLKVAATRLLSFLEPNER